MFASPRQLHLFVPRAAWRCEAPEVLFGSLGLYLYWRGLFIFYLCILYLVERLSGLPKGVVFPGLLLF
jgi:hypothetical protein